MNIGRRPRNWLERSHNPIELEAPAACALVDRARRSRRCAFVSVEAACLEDSDSHRGLYVMKKVTSICHLFATLALGTAVLGGCSACIGQKWGDSSAPRAQAMLVAARANDISLFGDFPGASNSVFLSRLAVPMKRHSFSEIGADFDAGIDATGQRIVFASTRHSVHPDLYVKSVDGVAVTQLTSDAASDVQPAFSPDGSRVAFASDRAGQWDIWIIDLNGGPPVQVTSSPAEEIHPSWSPDGQRLVYCSLPANGGQWELWITDTEAGAARRFVGYGLFPEWSPVQDQIAFQRARERGSRWFSIWTLTLVNDEPRHPTELAASSTESMTLPTWSPDGKHVAFASAAMWPAQSDALNLTTASGVFDIWIMKADGRGKRRLTDGHTMNHGPVFSPDERIYFSSSRSGQENIWSMGLSAVTGSQPDNQTTSRTGHRVPPQTPAARIVAADDGL